MDLEMEERQGSEEHKRETKGKTLTCGPRGAGNLPETREAKK